MSTETIASGAAARIAASAGQQPRAFGRAVDRAVARTRRFGADVDHVRAVGELLQRARRRRPSACGSPSPENESGETLTIPIT